MRSSIVLLLVLHAGGPSASSRAERVKDDIAQLASDEMQGRAPGTEGGERAARYIAASFESAGLTPWSGSSFLQPVPLSGRRSLGDELVVDGRRVPASAFVVTVDSEEPQVEISARLVRAGHGISLPETGWDDYRDVDVRGALVAVLPGVPEDGVVPGGPWGFFARPEYKLAVASEKGALGVVFLEEEDASSRIASFRKDLERERILPAFDAQRPLVLVRADATALEAGREIRIRYEQSVRRFTAPNVVGILRGHDPHGEAVLLTAHYDAYGVGPADESGDAVYNGALDNASGAAALLELARDFASRRIPLPRTLVFVATTAEEQGALGARFYASNPAVPLERTVVQLNLDGLNLTGPTEDFLLFPSEGIDLGGTLPKLAGDTGMTLSIEPWQRGMHFSFDTAALLSRGLAGITLWQGSRFRGLTPDDASERRRRFGRIHTPGDEWPGWGDDAAIEQHLALYRRAIELFAGDAPAPRLSGVPFSR